MFQYSSIHFKKEFKKILHPRDSQMANKYSKRFLLTLSAIVEIKRKTTVGYQYTSITMPKMRKMENIMFGKTVRSVPSVNTRKKTGLLGCRRGCLWGGQFVSPSLSDASVGGRRWSTCSLRTSTSLSYRSWITNIRQIEYV